MLNMLKKEHSFYGSQNPALYNKYFVTLLMLLTNFSMKVTIIPGLKTKTIASILSEYKTIKISNKR